jgi:SAM-dependent methyltransferase
MDAREHWQHVYASKVDQQLSWTQDDPRAALSLIAEVCQSGRIIDVGGGTSVQAERLLDAGYRPTVLDISQAALDRAQARLGPRAGQIRWVQADVTSDPDLGTCDLWHDRAVFHFLTDAADRAAYIRLLERTVPSGRHAVIATFALDGPPQCSGLDVCRYDGPSLAAELGERFILLKSVPEMHVTPWGTPQSFQYSLFRRA